MGENDFIDIPIPKVIVDKINSLIRNSEFSNVSEYIVFILKEVLAQDDAKSGLSQEEEAQVKETLKKLGYL